MKTWVKKIMLEKIMVFMFGADEVDTNFWGFELLMTLYSLE